MNPPIEFFLNKKAPCTTTYSCPWNCSCIGEAPGCPIDGRHKKICRKCDYTRPCESLWSNEEQKYLLNPIMVEMAQKGVL